MIVLVVLFIQLIWLGEFMRGRIKKLHKKPFILISIMSLIFVIIIQKMFNLQYLNYPNYIYSKYGITIIQLQFMNFVALLELMLFITIYLFNVGGRTSTNLNIPVSNVKFLGNNNMFNGKITFEKVSVLISTLSIFGLFVLSTSVFLDWTKLSSTSREGYEAKVGKDYKYIELISTKTSKDVKIIHPPQGNTWPAIGNQPLIRYFLYPRILISGALIDNNEITQEIGEAYFIEINSDNNLTHWPLLETEKMSVTFNETYSVKYEKLDVIFMSDYNTIYKITF